MGLAWGGYSNGSIPPAALHIAPNFSSLGIGFASVAAGSNAMRTDAAIQLSGMMRAFWEEFGVALRLSEGYRSRGVQNQYWDRYVNRKPGWTIAAVPGTSIHGWGLSADLNVEGGNPSGVHLAWLRANAAKYGFVNDVSTEPWHWSYRTDLVTRTIVVPGYIDNPNTSESSGAAGNSSNVNLEDDMPRLIQIEEPNNKALHGRVSFLFATDWTDTTTSDEVYRLGRVWGLVPPNKDWHEYVEKVSAAEYQAGIDGIKHTQQELARLVWAHAFNSGATAGTTLVEARAAAVAAPKATWQYRFNSGAQAGATLQSDANKDQDSFIAALADAVAARLNKA